MPQALVILCTCPNDTVARELARSLVDRGLAGCVNILPAIRSIYPWQGKVCDEEEVLMVIKTLKPAYAALEAWLREHHPYDVPEVVAMAAEAVSPDYLAWLETGVAK